MVQLACNASLLRNIVLLNNTFRYPWSNDQWDTFWYALPL